MDIFIPVALVIIFFLIFTICGWCCKRHREGMVYGYGGTPVSVGQNVNASPVVVPPYPIDPRHPTPQTMQQQPPPAPGFISQPMGYQQTPGYPPGPAPAAYGCFMPPPGPNVGFTGGGYPPTVAPYPPATQNAPPPSYHEAVGERMPPTTNEIYAKQAPYNPNY